MTTTITKVYDLRTLKPMTDFVFQVVNGVFPNEYPCEEQYVARLNILSNYANFLRQPLTLEMFIGEEALFEGFILCADEEGSYIENEADVTLFPDEFGTATIEQLVQDDLTLTQKSKDIIYGNNR